jgi:hypothetical protein
MSARGYATSGELSSRYLSHSHHACSIIVFPKYFLLYDLMAYFGIGSFRELRGCRQSQTDNSGAEAVDSDSAVPSGDRHTVHALQGRLQRQV